VLKVELQIDRRFPGKFPSYLPEGYYPLNDPPIELVSYSEGDMAFVEDLFVDSRGRRSDLPGSISCGSGN
jgi:hypothetical protein